MRISLSGQFLEDTDIPVIWDRDDDDPTQFLLQTFYADTNQTSSKRPIPINSGNKSGTTVVRFKHPGMQVVRAFDPQTKQFLSQSNSIMVVESAQASTSTSSETSSVFETSTPSVSTSLPTTVQGAASDPSTSATPLSASSSSTVSTALIVGIVIAAVVAFILIGTTLFLWVRRRKRKAPSSFYREMMSQRSGDGSLLPPRGPGSVISSQASMAGLLQGPSGSIASFNTKASFPNPFSRQRVDRDSLITPFQLPPGEPPHPQQVAYMSGRQAELQSRIQNWQANVRSGGQNG